MPFSLIIADDHALTTEGVKAILAPEEDIKIVGNANNGIETIALIRKHQPDCAIVDLAMPGANGLEVLIDAKRWSPDTKIIIVTGNSAPTQFQLLKNAAADAILLKNNEPCELVKAIRSVLEGNRVFPCEVQKILDSDSRERNLSKREVEVLIGISRGFSNQKISQSLGVSPKTVDSHRTNLMRKFEVNGTATLLLKAMREGYLDV